MHLNACPAAVTMSDITQALFGSAQSMQVVRCVFERFLHRRLAERSESTNAVWARSGHWGMCGQSCPCCRYQAGAELGYCEACDDAVRSLRVVCVIASFIDVEHPKRDIAARLAAIFGRRSRTLPVSVMAQIIDMLPGTTASRLASLVLHLEHERDQLRTS